MAVHLSNINFTAGPVEPLSILNGGTGQSTAPLAIKALLPAYTDNSGKFLTTDGTNISWATVSADAGTLSGTTLNSTIVSSSLTSLGAGVTDGTHALGWKIIPQNSQSVAYTFVLADSGKHVLHPAADTTARTFTINSNANVAYPIGTALTVVNQNGAGVVTIDITADTMRLAGAGTTGARTLAANGVATAIKITATEWIISGTGLT